MKIFILLLFLFYFNLAFGQDYRDLYTGTYQCKKKIDESGSIRWENVNLYIDKNENDSLKVNIGKIT